MRGKVHFLQPCGILTRITPAYAGKRQYLMANEFMRRDHPRLCGEKLNCRKIERHDEGSPPPMRGKAKTDLFDFFEIRITPAYAGKSGNSGVALFDIEDHPRLCGEKSAGISRPRVT